MCFGRWLERTARSIRRPRREPGLRPTLSSSENPFGPAIFSTSVILTDPLSLGKRPPARKAAKLVGREAGGDEGRGRSAGGPPNEGPILARRRAITGSLSRSSPMEDGPALLADAPGRLGRRRGWPARGRSRTARHRAGERSPNMPNPLPGARRHRRSQVRRRSPRPAAALRHARSPPRLPPAQIAALMRA